MSLIKQLFELVARDGMATGVPVAQLPQGVQKGVALLSALERQIDGRRVMLTFLLSVRVCAVVVERDSGMGGERQSRRGKEALSEPNGGQRGGSGIESYSLRTAKGAVWRKIRLVA